MQRQHGPAAAAAVANGEMGAVDTAGAANGLVDDCTSLDENLSEQLATLDDALSADPATLSGLDLGALLVDPGSEAAAGNAQ